MFTLIMIRTKRLYIRSEVVKYISPIIFSLLLFAVGFIHSDFTSLVMSYIVLLLLIVSVIKDKLINNLFTFVSLFITLSILDMITAFMITHIFYISLSESIEDLVYKIIAWIISRGLLFFLFPKFNFYFNVVNILKEKTKYSLIIILLFDLIFLLLGYTIYYNFYTVDISVFIIIMITGLVVFNYLLNNLLHKINEIGEQEKEWEKKENMYRLRLNNIEQEYQYIEHFHRERHDFKQHLQMILAYISTDSLKAKQYIYTLNQKIDDFSDVGDSKYPEIITFINYKINNAADKGITVDKDINIPDDLNVDIIDLTVVIGNLMDNAIEANERVSPSEKRITLKIYIKNDYLLIHTENPYKEIIKNEDNEFITTKEDKNNHGIGLQNINFIVEKYSGFMDIDHSNQIFTMKIALGNLKEEVFSY